MVCQSRCNAAPTETPTDLQLLADFDDVQAEAKAAEASAQAQDYYHKLQNSWTPHWLQQKWSQGEAWASRTLLSDKSGKQNSLGQYVTVARVKLLAFWNAATVG